MASFAPIFFASRTPSVTAGLMWQPDMGPMAYAIASSAKPNASATPKNPMWLPARTALPTPPNTNTKVPTNSAEYLFISFSYGAKTTSSPNREESFCAVGAQRTVMLNPKSGYGYCPWHYMPAAKVIQGARAGAAVLSDHLYPANKGHLETG